MVRRRTVEGVNGYPPHGRERPGAGGGRPDGPMRPRFQEKTTRINPSAVPKPTQVGWYKDTKARGRNLVKELGNMTP